MGITGWILFLALAWISRDRILGRMEGMFLKDGSAYATRLEAREAEAKSLAWQDERPTLLFLGDSHVEMGRWYELFQGRYAIRNLGLSQAQIPDTIRIASAMESQEFAGVVVICGINDLGAGRTAEDCLRNYRDLLEQLKRLAPESHTLVVSVFPVIANPLDTRASLLNDAVWKFNRLLEPVCREAGVMYVDAASGLASGEALHNSLTWDGLHLNERGYEHVALALGNLIPPLTAGSMERKGSR
jgi:lysophospholipase L1-like esterase